MVYKARSACVSRSHWFFQFDFESRLVNRFTVLIKGQRPLLPERDQAAFQIPLIHEVFSHFDQVFVTQSEKVRNLICFLIAEF